MAEQIAIEVVPTFTAQAAASVKKFFADSFEAGVYAAKAVGPAVGYAAGVAAVGGMAATAATVGAPMAAVAGLDVIATLVSKFTNALNPAMMEMFDAAVKDIFAVIGQSLMPAFEILIPAVQMLGDFIASILPSGAQMKELFDAMKPALAAVKSVLVQLAPIINDMLVGALHVLAEAVTWLANAIKSVVDWINGQVRNFKIVANAAEGEALAKRKAELLAEANKNVGTEGATKFTDQSFKSLSGEKQQEIHEINKALDKWMDKVGAPKDFAKTSRGAAAHGASYVGLGDLTKGAILAGFGGGGSPEKETAENTKKILELVEKGVVDAATAIAPKADEARGSNPT